MRSRTSTLSLSGLALAGAILVAALFVGPVFARKSLAANVIRHSDWRIRSFAALKKSSEAFARQKVWKVFNKNVEKFVEKASPGTLTARTANA